MVTLDNLVEILYQLEKNIGYEFNKKQNLILALTHSSYANERKNEKLSYNERLEFLGDAVLNIITSDYLYKNCPNLTEGQLTKIRANIVCEASLAICSNNLKIGNFLLLGKGEELTGGRTRISILSDAFEALIASIYLDGGMDQARKFVLSQMENIFTDSISGIKAMDYKTQLQELVQSRYTDKLYYIIIDEKGPDHNKTFVSQVKLDEKVLGTGEGHSKKEAEQHAARVALDMLKETHNVK